MGFLKFVAGLAIAVLLAKFLPQSLNVWLRLGIIFLGYSLVTIGSDIFCGAGFFGSIAIVVALAMLSGVMVGLNWLIISVVFPLVDWLFGNDNASAYVYFIVTVLSLIGGLITMIVAAIVMYKKNRRYQKDKSETERLANEDELIQQKLATVKGNWLKKEMIAQKLKRQYVEQKMSDHTSAHKQAMAKWDSVYDWSSVAFVFGAVPIGFVLLFCLWCWLTM